MLNNGIGHQAPPYGLSTAEETRFIAKLLTTPLSRVLFVTIRDPNQASGKWLKLGKINDWIRRYADNYYIVRGTASGSHFHLLAIIKKDARKIKPQKGIHFHIVSMLKNVVEYDFEDETERRESKEKAIYFTRQTFDMLTLDITPEAQDIIISIVTIIKGYWRKKTAKAKRVLSKDKRTANYQRLLAYMDLNLNEPREDGETPELYKDYINKEGQ